MADIDHIFHRQEQMERFRGNWESLWESVARLVLPKSDDFRIKRAPGEVRNQHQYDAFPMAALEKWAAAVEAGTMPRQTYWHKMTTGDPELDERHDVALYLEDLNSRLWKTRYSPMANFSSQAHEKRLSLGAFGTGALLVEGRKGGGTKYRAIHLAELFIEENDEGLIDLVHRKFELSVRNAVKKFREATPQKILDKYNAGKFNETFDFLHVVGPRGDFQPGMLDKRGMAFEGFYIFVEGKEVIREEGFRSQPYIVSRHALSSKEVYGRSPAIMMLPDISMLNEMRRTTIEAANMVVDKPLLMHDDVSEFDLMPGGRNPGTLDDNGNPLVRAWDSDPRVDIGMEMIADTRSQIDDGFLGVYFRVLLENPNMTATQAMLIAQQQGQMTSPTVGRLQTEWMGPMIRRESSILHAQGRAPQMPQVLQDFLRQKGDGLEIRYESPMVRAARAEESVGILRTFETLAPIAQIDPTVYDGFDVAEIRRIVAEVNGVPVRALKSKERLAEDDAQKAAQQDAAMMLEAAPVAAQTAKTMAEVQQMSQNNPGAAV